MSRYIDNSSGRWFDTLAELKAFQRGEASVSPQVVSKPKKAETRSDVEEEPKVKETKEVSNEQEVQEEKETEVERKLEASDNKISFNLSSEEMRKQLKEAGIDGRTLRRSDEELAKLYVEFFNKRV